MKKFLRRGGKHRYRRTQMLHNELLNLSFYTGNDAKFFFVKTAHSNVEIVSLCKLNCP